MSSCRRAAFNRAGGADVWCVFDVAWPGVSCSVTDPGRMFGPGRFADATAAAFCHPYQSMTAGSELDDVLLVAHETGVGLASAA